MSNNTSTSNIFNTLNSSSLIKPIILFNEENKELTITEEKLELWLAYAAKNSRQYPDALNNKELCLSLLSHFGLNYPIEVLGFLNSPLGKQIEAIRKKEFIALAILDEKQYQNMLDEQALHNRRLALLLLGMTIRKSKKNQELNQSIQNQIDKTLRKKPNAEEKQKLIEVYQLKIDSYDEILYLLNCTLEEKAQEKKQLEEQINVLEKQIQAINEKYSLLTIHLKQNDFSKSLLSEEEIKEKIKALENRLGKRIQSADSSFHTYTFEEQSDFLFFKALTQRLTVIKDQHKLYDENGEETSSFERATYVLTPKQRIVSRNGVFYLLEINQDLNVMKEAEKNEAQLRFERTTPTCYTAQKSLTHYQQEERRPASELINTCKFRLKLVKVEIELLTRQSKLVRDTRMAIEQELLKQAPDVKKLKQLHKTAPTPMLNEVAKLRLKKLESALTLLKTQPSATNVYNFSLALRNSGGYNESIKNILNKIKSGQPIPPKTIEFLQKSVNSLKTPENRPLEPKSVMSTAPNPFSMTPSPFPHKK